MNEPQELIKRLREAEISIRNDGTDAQVGLTADECAEVASRIAELEIEIEAARRFGSGGFFGEGVTEATRNFYRTEARAAVQRIQGDGT